MTSDDPISSTSQHKHHPLPGHHRKLTESLSSKMSEPPLCAQNRCFVYATAHRYDSSTTRLRTRVQRSLEGSDVVRLSLDSGAEKERDNSVMTKPRRQIRELRWLSVILLLLTGSLVILIAKHIRDLLRFQLLIRPRVFISTLHTTNTIPITVTTITTTASSSKRPVTAQSVGQKRSRDYSKSSDDFLKAYDAVIRNISSMQRLPRYLVNTINNAQHNTLSPNETFPSPVHDHPVYLALEPYLRWHAAQLKCVHDPHCFYSGAAADKSTDTEHNRSQTKKQQSESQPPRILLWICPRSNRRACHGVGDRFRGIVSAFAYAILTQRIFLIHWPDNPHALVTAVIPGVVDWRVPSHMFFHMNNEYDYIDVPDGSINISTWPRIETTAFPDMKWVQAPPGYTLPEPNQSLKEDNGRYGSGNKSSKNNIGPGQQKQNIPSSTKKALTRHTNVFARESDALLDSLPHLAMQSRGTFAPSVYRHPAWEARFPTLRNWTSRQGYHINRIMLRLLFKPSPVTAHLLTKIVRDSETSVLQGKRMKGNSGRSAVNSTAADSNYVAVHVRTGIDVAETYLPRFQSQHLVQGTNAGAFSPRFYTLVEEVVKCLRQKSEIQRGKERVLFASDSLSLKQVFAKVAAQHGIIVLYTNVSAMHVDDDNWAKRKMKKRKEMTTKKLKKSIMTLHRLAHRGRDETVGSRRLKDKGEDAEPNEDEELARFINVFVEFFGIARGSAVVASASEFSRLAYVMSDAKWLVKMNVAKQGNTNWTACPWGV